MWWIKLPRHFKAGLKKPLTCFPAERNAWYCCGCSVAVWMYRKAPDLFAAPLRLLLSSRWEVKGILMLGSSFLFLKKLIELWAWLYMLLFTDILWESFGFSHPRQYFQHEVFTVSRWNANLMSIGQQCKLYVVILIACYEQRLLAELLKLLLKYPSLSNLEIFVKTEKQRHSLLAKQAVENNF